MGQLVTVYALTYAVASPLLIALTGNWSRRTLLLSGLVLVATGNLVGALSSSYAILFSGRVVAALGAAVFTPTASSVAAALSEPADRGKAIGLVFAGFTVATAFGVPIGTFIGFSLGWRAALFLIVGVALVAGVAVFATVPGNVDVPRVNLARLLEVFRKPALLLVLSVTVFQMTAQFVIFTYIAPLLNYYLGLSTAGITLTLFAFGAASIVGNVVAGYSSDGFGTKPSILVSLIVLGATFLVLPLASSSVILVGVLIFVWGAVGFGYHTPQQARLVDLAPSLQSTVLALNASALYLGTSAGALVGGFVGSRVGLGSLAWVAAGLVGVALALYLGSRNAERVLAST